MTLSVDAYYNNENGEEITLNFSSQSGCNDLAGAESSRKEFYGSSFVKELGLKILPRLGDGEYLIVEGEELLEVEAEIRLLLENIQAINDDGYWEFRLKNVLEAARMAKEYGMNGGISIG